ncbi:entericidin A/B family lipoprotein [Variovorax sp.]|nr:entericidin A/B family lipoprotein [Variovorax sp.]HYP84780.1 entericidin A/B family lipoprotein [Variovorax sp.]
MKKLTSLLAIAFTLAVPLAGCNTIEGAGQDIQKGGQKLENAADKKK